MGGQLQGPKQRPRPAWYGNIAIEWPGFRLEVSVDKAGFWPLRESQRVVCSVNPTGQDTLPGPSGHNVKTCYF